MEHKRALDLNGVGLRQRRKLLGLERADFAARIGVSPAYVSHLENGIRKPSPTVFKAICDALGVPEEERPSLLTSEEAA